MWNQYADVEALVNSLQARMPDTPTYSLLNCRLMVQVSDGISSIIEQIARPFGLSEVEFQVLATLCLEPESGSSLAELCSRALLTAGTIYRINDGLVRRSLVARDSAPTDRRKRVLRITDQGKTLIAQLLPMVFAALGALCDEFTEDQLRALTASLTNLATRLPKEPRRQAHSATRPSVHSSE